MIKIKAAEIYEFRGIRSLRIALDGRNFAVCGPNGTGKSGIVDALEFGLTGSISRLAGKGTGGLTVREHGPHVDSRNNPAKARVVLHVALPTLGIDATIDRTVLDAGRPRITPDTPEVRAIFDNAAAHPEFVLSRREIIQYILAEPGKRSKEVQALLRLDQVETLRTSLQRIAHALEREAGTLARTRKQNYDALCRALGITQATEANVLAAANAKRVVLGLPELTELTTSTSIKDGLTGTSAAIVFPRISKQLASGELARLRSALAQFESAEFQKTKDAIAGVLIPLAENPLVSKNMERDALIREALRLFDSEECPVCGTHWDQAEFVNAVNLRLKQYEEAATQRRGAEVALRPVTAALGYLRNSLSENIRNAAQLVPPVNVAALQTLFDTINANLGDLESLLPVSSALAALSGLRVASEVHESIGRLGNTIDAIPEPSIQDAARDYLSAGQERLEAYREAALMVRRAEEKTILANKVCNSYVVASTNELDGLYKEVEKQFSEYYRFINGDDEAQFQARLTPSMAKLAFDVDFYGRGFFPPGANHSEGHQDGMGLCLYLALMNHLLGSAFCLAVLDDVVMSVDTGHRREVCKLLKEKFPNTQFILTTHDEVWLRQMGTAGLIAPKAFIQFRRWDVAHGPMEWSDRDVWEEIESDLANNDVRSAAALLRHFLEYFSRDVCDQIGAKVEFRADGRYELGELLPAAVSRMGELLRRAKSAAQSWSDTDRFQTIQAIESDFKKTVSDTDLEKWQINPIVHYNEWANFGKADFRPVVAAFKALVGQFRCAACGAVLYVVLDGFTLDALRCSCTKVNLNLRSKAA